jgi:myo-inositol-1(or 4)-monophosphatase
VLNSAKQADIVKPDLKTVIVLLKRISIRLLNRTRDDYAKQIKPDGSIVTEIDRAMQTEISEALQERWPGYGFIGEEMSFDDQVSISETNPQGYWVLDPLDGTTNFTSNFLFYGVSLALVIDGEPVLAVVFDPVRDECFSAAKGAGAFLNDSLLVCPSTRSLDRCIANVDYKRLVGDLSAQLVRCPPYRSQRNLGSSVLEWCWLAAGRIQLYLHGGQKLWDFAAGYLILLEAGGAATSLSGLPLDCSKLRKRSVVAAVNQDLLDQWVEWIDANSEISQSAPF